MNKKLVLIAIIALFLLVNVLLFRSNTALKRSIQAERIEFDQKLEVKQEKIRSEVKKDLEAKYRADIISYQAMARRMELERKKMRELEEEVEELKR